MCVPALPVGVAVNLICVAKCPRVTKNTDTWGCKQESGWRAAIVRAHWYEGLLLSPGSVRHCPVSVSKLHPEELGVLGRVLQRRGGGRGPVGGGRPGVAGGRRGAVEAVLPVLQRPRGQRGEPRRAGEAGERQCGAALLSPVFISAGEGEEVRQQRSSPSPGDRQDCQIHSSL